MPSLIHLPSLASSAVRDFLTQGSPNPGFRIIRNEPPPSGNIVQQTASYLGSFFSSSIQFIGWTLSRFVPLLNFTWTKLWGTIVGTSTFIYNFNWNITDENIEQQFEASKIVMASMLGATFGEALGYLLCGVVPAATIATFNEPLGLYLLEEVGEEGLEEFAANLGALITVSFRLSARNFFLSQYKNLRKAIKEHNSSSNSAFKSAINALLGGKLNEAIESWGEKDTKPWSFRLFIEEKIENIQNPQLQAFVEEFYESTLDACVEAGYVLAGGLDRWVIEQRLRDREEEEETCLVELTPDRKCEDERILLYGTDKQIKTQAMQLMGGYQLVENRDVGQIIGEPLIDSIRRPPFDLVVRILFRSVPKPVWKHEDGTTAKRTQITIPSVKKSKLDWLTIKNAVGGINGYMWGRFRFEVRLEDDNRIQFYAASETEGENLLEKLLELVDSDLQTLNIIEEKKEGARKKYSAIYKENCRVYPAMMSIINQQKIANQDLGKQTTRGVYVKRKYLFPLYPSSPPDEFEAIKQEILSTKPNPAAVF